MANINEILARAAALRDETALNSISPERAGGIMYDTLIALNELWLQQGAALVISKIYASVAAMEADTAPVSDLTGQPLRPGQIVVIASSDSDNGSVYRYNGTSSPSWSLVGEIGNLEPVDSLDSDSTSLPLAAHQGKVLDGKISQLGQFYAHTNDSRLDPIIREIYIDESIVSGFDYFYLNIYPSINVFRIVGVASGIETIIFQSSFPANANSIVELETGQEWPESGVLFGYAIIDATGQMPSSDIGGVRLYNTGLWDNPAIKSYIDNQGLERNFNAKVFDLSARISHVDDADVKKIIQEIYIDTSVVSGFDRYIFNWYKDLGLFRVSGVSGSTETLLTQEAWTPNTISIIPLMYNGSSYGYIILNTNNTSNNKYDLALYRYSIYENPAIYAFINDELIYKRIVHTENKELNDIIKEIYIDTSVVSGYDSIIINWYKTLGVFRIVAVKNGVQTIVEQEVFPANTNALVELRTNQEWPESGVLFGYMVVDTTKTITDDVLYEVPISRYGLYDNPVIYSYILGIDDAKINYITATRNAANFNSIREIVNSINDANAKNQYIILVPKGEWFECDLNGKDFVKIIGESRDETILYCDGTSSNVTPSDYSLSAYQNTPLNQIPEHNKHCIMQRFNIDLENLTIRINDAKYCIHVGASDLTGNSYDKLHVKNCKLIAGENTNCPVGIGADNYTASFDNCIFQDFVAGAVGIHCHNHSNSDKPLILNVNNCLFDGCDFINAGELGSMQDDYYNIINCHSTVTGIIYYYVDPSLSWINPSTGQQETDASKYPYSIKINASGSNVQAIYDKPINSQPTRPNAQKYISCGHYITIDAGSLSVGDVIRGIIDQNHNIIPVNGGVAPVIGVVENIIDGIAYIATKRVVLRYAEMTAGNPGDPAYIDANGKITNVQTGVQIGVFGSDYEWGYSKDIILNP